MSEDKKFWDLIEQNHIELDGEKFYLDKKYCEKDSDLFLKYNEIKGINFFKHSKNKIENAWVEIVKGKSKYTGDYILKNKGEYKVYSSNTDEKTKGICGYINSYDYEEESIHFTSNGEKAGTIFLIDESKFSMNGDRGMFRLLNNNTDIKYLFLAIKKGFAQNNFDWSNKPSNEKISELIDIKIPKEIIIKNKEISSFELQKKIAELKINKIKRINSKINKVESLMALLEKLKKDI